MEHFDEYFVDDPDEEEEEEEEDLYDYLNNENLITHALMSQTINQAKTFWSYREKISTSLVRFSPYKFDIAVLLSKISTFMNEVDRLFKEADIALYQSKQKGKNFVTLYAEEQ